MGRATAEALSIKDGKRKRKTRKRAAAPPQASRTGKQPETVKAPEPRRSVSIICNNANGSAAERPPVYSWKKFFETALGHQHFPPYKLSNSRQLNGAF